MGLKGREDSRCGLKGKINGFEEIRGYSAYEVALINGFDGTEEEWLASLKGTTDELPPPVYLVTCTGNLVDQPINDILAAYQAGRSVKLKHGDHLLNLMHVSDVDLLFSSTSGSINYSAVVNMQHKTILYSETTLAKKSDIPTKTSELENDSGFLAVAAPVNAAVGQTIVVKEVDENGKPTQWEVADLPTGGNATDYRLIYQITIDENNQVSWLTITEDMDGKPFALTKVFVYANTKGCETGRSDAGITFNDTVGISWVFNIDTNEYLRAFAAEVIGDNLYFKNHDPIDKSNGYASSNKFGVRKINSKINKIKWATFSGLKLPIGSTFTIYGC